ncbi:MAG: dephospho-CoA kinase [Methylotenera sp.]|nr:dephospho-CoA kinase [Methylotenera sp.]
MPHSTCHNFAPMYVVALTGGIGSGKSEASKQFSSLGVPVVDTDVIAHELTALSSPLLKEIERIFGASFFNADGTLNRAKLRTHIFSNADEKLKLEQLMHPAIYQKALQTLQENEQKLHPTYQLLVVPLLFESTRYQSISNTTLVIDCDESLQVNRAMERSQLSADDVKKLMLAQTSRENRRNLADTIIDNSGTVSDLTEKINEFHKKLINTCIVSK